jgi:hypothetical protein
MRRKTHMDNNRKWNPVEDLEDTEALLHSGALPVDEEFSLEDILKEYGADTAPVSMKEAQRPIPVLEEPEEEREEARREERREELVEKLSLKG